MLDKEKLKGEGERSIYFKDEPIADVKEQSRYLWARGQIELYKVRNENKGEKIKVLDLGCGCGYGSRFFEDEKILYFGMDYDADVIDFAKQEYGDKFLVKDISKGISDLGNYDFIVCLEVLEHLENCRELAQELKKHCKVLLISSPYKEPEGFWGKFHKCHNLKEEDFPGFRYFYEAEDGNVRPDLAWELNERNRFNLMLMKWKKDSVTAEVSTKDRYFSTLPLCLTAIGAQNLKPDRVVVFDDGEQKDLRQLPVFANIFQMYNAFGIEWHILFGEKKGQVANHQNAIKIAGTEFVWRLDDDNYPEQNVLEELLKVSDEKTGAVGSLVLHPNMYKTLPDFVSNKIEDITLGLNEQWFVPKEKKIKEADHLYSTFLFRTEAAKHGYCRELSPVGHSEETLFTYEMHRNGWKILINPFAVTWHFRDSQGGIRSFKDKTLWEHDEKIFKEKMKGFGIELRTWKSVFLSNGLGDHFVFKKILPEMLEKYGEKNIIVACTYKNVFWDYDDRIKIISLQEAYGWLGDLSKYDIYKYCIDINHDTELEQAFRKLYL